MVNIAFTAAHLNVWSMLPKFNSLSNFILDNNFDIFALSETWLNASIPNESLHITGYSLIRQDRDTRGGGVAFYLRDTYPFEIIDTSSDIEQLWIVTTVNKARFVFGVFYNPPRANPKSFTDHLEEAFSIAMQFGNEIICFGDINIDLLNINLSATRYLISMLESLDLHQIVAEPTHITPTSSTLLDVIICSDVNIVSSVKVGGLDISNHQLVQCEFCFNKNNVSPKYITYGDYTYFNENQFNVDLHQLPLDNILHNSVDAKIDYLTMHLLSLFNQHVPLKTVRVNRKKAPWLTDNLKSLMKQRDRAKSEYKRNPSPAKWSYYKQIRNATTHAQTAEKLAYFNYIATNKDSKKLWGELKSLNIKANQSCKNLHLPSHLLDPDIVNNHFLDNIPQNNIDISNILNYYDLNRFTHSNFKFKLISRDIIQNVLHNLKNASAGVDSLSISFLKLCCPYLLNYIVHVTNSIFIDCQFPAAWKVGLVTPIPKVSNPKNLSDLRPISILSGLSKIVEKVMEIQIRQHLENYNILPVIQSGFRPGHSCSTALMHIVDDIVEATDVGKCTVLVLLDYSKAFDTLDHNVLYHILKSCGLDCESVKLFQSYLGGRSQLVRIGESLSQERLVTKGVPQGSILGPLLFTIYTSQFAKFVKSCSLHMYADDTQLYYSFYLKDYQSAMQIINDDLSTLSEVSLQHSLFINSNKSAMLVFGKKRDALNLSNLINININGNRLALSQNAKNLGLILDNTLRFRDQVNKMIQRAYTGLRFLYPHRKYLNINTKKMLCEALVLSQFTYCAPVYGPCLDVDSSNRVQRVQNACIRFIYGIRKFEHVSHKLPELHWLNMRERLKFYSLSLYHKIILTKTPPYLYNKIKFRSDVHNLNIRSKGLLSPPAHKTSVFERGFRFCIYKLYNRVPLDAKLFSLNRFKKHMKAVIFSTQI